jgi:hypothetical protein
MADGHHYDAVGIFLKDHSPIPDTQSRTGPAPQPLYIALSRRDEFRKARIDTPPNIVRKLDPLPRRGRREENLLHAANIAYRDSGSRKYREMR